MQGLSVIGRNGAANWPQHEITRQQKKEITESQQKTWPLTLADIDQVQGKPGPRNQSGNRSQSEEKSLHDRDDLTGPQPFIAADDDRVTVTQIANDFYLLAATDAGRNHDLPGFPIFTDEKN